MNHGLIFSLPICISLANIPLCCKFIGGNIKINLTHGVL